MEKINCIDVEVKVGVDPIKEWTKKRIFTFKKRPLGSKVRIVVTVKSQLVHEHERVGGVDEHLVGEVVGGRRDRVLLPLARGEALHS